MRNKIRLYYWNPNGTNDGEIVDSRGRVLEGIEELTFGINLNDNSATVPLKTVLRCIAVSPIDDGRDKIKTLKKYFKFDLRRKHFGIK